MKKALVTGASGGIGEAITKKLASDGYEIIVHANSNQDKAQVIVDDIVGNGGVANVVCFDVCNEEQTQNALKSILKQGPVQVLVNNAGAHEDMIFAGMDARQWHKVINVTLDGFYNVTRPLLLPMMRTRWGRIVNITSISGILGNVGQVNYSAAKAGLHGATKALAREVASRGVTVNAVAPGLIDTPMTKGIFTEEQVKEMIPMKRTGKPEEVADLVGFLCSPNAAYVSGQIISVSGAMI